MQNILLLAILLISGLVTIRTIPLIVTISRKKKILDEPSNRKSHIEAIPHLGGIAIFFGFIIGIFLIDYLTPIPEFESIILALILLFFTGLKDDVIGSTPYAKLIMQIISLSVLIFMGGLRFTNLHGFLGINEISELTSILLTFFVLVVIINTFNLIDGVDGLAAAIGITTSITLGIWFFVSGNINFAAFAFTLSACLMGFFFYNVFGKRYKIFMGDTGSMTIGILISILIINFNELNINGNEWYSIKSTPAVSFAILAIPLLDTLKVFFVRLINKRSPFKPDKAHFHHELMARGLSHFNITLVIVLVNSLIIVGAFLFQSIGVASLIFSIFTLGLILFFLINRFVTSSK